MRIAGQSWDETAMIEEKSFTWVNGSRSTRLARRLLPGRRTAALMRGDGIGQHVQYGPIAKLHQPGRLRVGLRRLNSHGRLNERQNVPELNVRYLRSLAEHQLPARAAAGVPVSLGSDGRLFFPPTWSKYGRTRAVSPGSCAPVRRA